MLTKHPKAALDSATVEVMLYIVWVRIKVQELLLFGKLCLTTRRKVKTVAAHLSTLPENLEERPFKFADKAPKGTRFCYCGSDVVHIVGKEVQELLYLVSCA